MFVWDLDPVLLKLGPLQIRYYGVCFLIALLGGFYLFRWQMMRYGKSEESIEKILLPGVLAVVIGSRLGHVFFYEFDKFLADPISILYFWKGGLASHGATVGLLILVVWYARSQRVYITEVGDRLSFAIAWAAIWVRIGNFTNSEVVGRITDVPWAVKFPRYDYMAPLESVPWRHPSQLYEALSGLILLLVLIAADKLMKKEERPSGALMGICLTYYFAARFLVEYFKEYQALSSSALTMGQYLSIPFALIGLSILARSFLRKVKR